MYRVSVCVCVCFFCFFLIPRNSNRSTTFCIARDPPGDKSRLALMGLKTCVISLHLVNEAPV